MKNLADNGAGAGAMPKPTESEADPEIIDAAGLAIKMQQMLPDPKLLPLLYVTLKMDHDLLLNRFNDLLKFMNDKGLNYDG